MLEIYKKLYGLLDIRERRRGALVLGLLVVGAFIETLGVASIMPFIAVLANPEIIETNPYLAAAYQSLGFSSRETFVVFLGSFFFVMVTLSLALRATSVWAQLRFSHNRDFAWSARLVGAYLWQPYEWFLNRHSADLATAVLAEVKEVVRSSLFPAMQLISHILVAAFLICLLIIVDVWLSLAVIGFLGGGYTLVAITFKQRLQRIGVERRQANHLRFNIVQEAFGGIKDIKVLGLEENVLRRFRKPAKVLAQRHISQGLMSQMPTYAMQILLFGGMLLIIMYLVATYGGFQEALPIAAVFALAGYRLMPGFQRIYQDFSMLKFSKAALDSLCNDFAPLQSVADGSTRNTVLGARNRLRLEKRLTLENISYTYPNADRTALQGLSLEIPAFAKVGLVGSTGSGKTTTVDVMLGLLRPHGGRLMVDGREVRDETLRCWQRSIGYVPQQIFLADNSVACNIAFGLSPEEIDMAAVERAAKVANLHDFIINQLPQGYQTYVGERGIRLSGGQRQRIGIARALYHDPDLLIFDEATSALDNLTEKAVMEAVDGLSGRKSIILIAHRLSTVKNCDRIYLLEQGRVVDQGSYEDLVATSEHFRSMAREA
jgi:ATP-binding cassette, subfamily B, bacterial PglK